MSPQQQQHIFLIIFTILVVNTNCTNNQQFIDKNTNKHDSTCYTVKLKDGQLTYCNITNTWKPSVKRSHALAAGFIIAILALVFIIIGIRKVGGTLKSLCCVCKHNAGCFALCNFVLAAVLRLLWKVVDVAIDVLTYYKLGSGSLIDSGIYRNPHVLNCLIAFTCVGVIAMLISIRLIYLKADELKENGDVETLKLLMVLIAFLLEDGIQMFLEYYWIQKYVTINIPVYLVIKDVIIAIIAFHCLLCSACVLRSESSSKTDYLFFVFGVVISLAEFLRVGAVIDQYKNGTFNRDCLQVIDGKLWQEPFNPGCMKSIDYWIIVLTFLPFLSIPFLIGAFQSDIKKCVDTIKYRFTSTELLSDGESPTV